MKANRETPSPLSPAALQILVALAAEDLHGYGIIKAIIAQSEGSIRLGPGSLYDNLKRFMEQGLVRDLQPASDSGKRLYRLTPAGKNILSQEIARLDRLVSAMRPYVKGLKPRRAE